MPWPCFMVDEIELTEPEPLPGGGSYTCRQWQMPSGAVVLWKDLPAGAMWFDAFTDNQGNVCRELCVKLPGGSLGNEWNIDEGKRLNLWRPGAPTRRPEWTRTGDPPNVTVTPSINWEGNYHGHLTAGILTDDLEGRKIA